jgi:hypothetical protein
VRQFVRPADTEAQAIVNRYNNRGSITATGVGMMTGIVVVSTLMVIPTYMLAGVLTIIGGLGILAIGICISYFRDKNYGKMLDAGRVLELNDATATLVDAAMAVIDEDAKLRKLIIHDSLVQANSSTAQSNDKQQAMMAAAQAALQGMGAQGDNSQ